MTEDLSSALEQWRGDLHALGTMPSDYANSRTHLLDILHQAFSDNAPIENLLHKLTHGTDLLLVKAWQLFQLDQEDLALFATGGYGRAELHPASDIDLLILSNKTPNKTQAEKLSTFITFLWDCGLDIGHSVRSYKDCKNEAKNDLTIITNLMENRLLTGDHKHSVKLNALVHPKKMWSAKAFFDEKLKEQQQRYQHFGASAYKLEPNLKESPGGLRDIHMVGWISKRFFGDQLEDFIKDNRSFARELDESYKHRNFLWKIRWVLHKKMRRKEDRVLFDFQHEIATALGYEESTRNASIEALMQDYYLAVTQLERLSDMHLQLLKLRIHPVKKSKITALNRRFQTNNGYIEVTNQNTFERYPFALLEIFLLLMQDRSIQGVRAETIRLIRENIHRIDDDFRADIANRSLFMEMLRQPHGITHEFRRMNAYGVLGAYIPAFQAVTGRMQFDLFHIYTVDEHIMMVLRNVRRLSVPEHAHTLPECTALFSELPKAELLYIAALYHDIAKGRDGDHSTLGAEMATEFCTQHELSEYDTEFVAWLVEQHLTMSVTAQRKDIDSPEVIKEFADLVGSPVRLKYLYLLTVCDIRGTDPDLWNGWKASLLATLYHNTYNWLTSEKNALPTQQQWISDIKKAAEKIMRDKGSAPADFARYWLDFDEEYFERFSPEEISWHAKILAQQRSEGLKAHIRPLTVRGATDVLVCGEVHPRFFTLITHTLEQLQLNIFDARIYTTNSGIALDSFQVLESDGTPCTEEFRQKEICDRLEAALSDPDAEFDDSNMLPRRLKSFERATTIKFQPIDEKSQTQVEIYSIDRPGLLADIARTFYDHGIRIKMARISTVGEQAQDTIHVTNADNEPLSEAEQNTLENSLMKAIDTAWANPHLDFSKSQSA